MFIHTLYSHSNSVNRVDVLGFNMFLGPCQRSFKLLPSARRKMSVRRAKNIFTRVNINSIVITNTKRFNLAENSPLAMFRDSLRSIAILIT